MKPREPDEPRDEPKRQPGDPRWTAAELRALRERDRGRKRDKGGFFLVGGEDE